MLETSTPNTFMDLPTHMVMDAQHLPAHTLFPDHVAPSADGPGSTADVPDLDHPEAPPVGTDLATIPTRWRPWEHVSASTVALYDVERHSDTACHRKWALEKVFGIKPPEESYQTAGRDLHGIVEDHYKTGRPVTDELLKPGLIYWPARGAAVTVEGWFSIEIPGWPDSRERKIVTKTGWPMGYGRWTGKADVKDKTNPRKPVIVDFKNLSSFQYISKPEALAKSVQMTAYGNLILSEPECRSADSVVLKHVVNLTKTQVKCHCGGTTSHDARAWLADAVLSCRSKKDREDRSECGKTYRRTDKSSYKSATGGPNSREVRIEVGRDAIAAEWQQTIALVHDMRDAAKIKNWQDHKPNVAACHAYMGCPHQTRCWGRRLRRGEDPTAAEKPQELVRVRLDNLLLDLGGFESPLILSDDIDLDITTAELPTLNPKNAFDLALDVLASDKATLATDEQLRDACAALIEPSKAVTSTDEVRRSAAGNVVAVRNHAVRNIAEAMDDKREELPKGAIQILRLTTAWSKSDSCKALGGDEILHPRTAEVLTELARRHKAAQAFAQNAAAAAPAAAPQNAPAAPAAQSQAAAPAKTQTPATATTPATTGSLYVFVDATPTKSMDRFGVSVHGSTLVAPFKDQVAQSLGIKHYSMIKFGEGTGAVAALAKAAVTELLESRSVVLVLDSSDPVQNALSHDLHLLATMHVKGGR